MKKIFVIAVFLLAVTYSFAHTARDIDKSVKDRFHVLFPQAQGETWSESQDTYVVYFINGGIQERVFYPKDGSYIKMIRYYGADELPAYIQVMLTNRLAGKKVFGVTEVATYSSSEAEGDIQYQLSMEDEHRWYQVIVDSRNEPHIVHRYRK